MAVSEQISMVFLLQMVAFFDHMIWHFDWQFFDLSELVIRDASMFQKHIEVLRFIPGFYDLFLPVF